MKKYFTREISIAIITIISGFILYAGLNYMKGTNVFKPTNYYLIKMDNINELQKASPVYTQGFKVGLVHEIDFGYENHEYIIVQVSLDKKMKVPKDSYFVIKSGLTSGAYLDLILNKYVSNYAAPGDTLDGRIEIGIMDKISESLLPHIATIMPRLDSILSGIQTLVSHPALAKSLDNISSVTTELKQSSQRLNVLTNDIAPVITNLDKMTANFAALSENLSKIDLNNTMQGVDSAITNIDRISAQFNSPDNSLGLLLNDSSLYMDLDSVALNLSKLLIDIKQNPKKYVKFSLF
jgi:phospholipid/cholesterol/gamma-HCH transport system substrate-binding protein